MELTFINIIVTTIPFNRAGSKVIFIDVINLDKDLDQLQVAISNSENSNRSDQSQQYSGHPASDVVDGIQVGCPCSCDPGRHRLGRRPPCEIRLPVLDHEARLYEHRTYLWFIARIDGSDWWTGADSESPLLWSFHVCHRKLDCCVLKAQLRRVTLSPELSMK